MVNVVSGIRGAIQIDADLPELVVDGTRELVAAMLGRNRIGPADVISILFTVTPDLSSAFPATAARAAGLHEVPLMCATEIDVPGALPRVIRLLAHVESSMPRSAVRHVYLRGATALRPDLALLGPSA
jgi:chorismate mutase